MRYLAFVLLCLPSFAVAAEPPTDDQLKAAYEKAKAAHAQEIAQLQSNLKRGVAAYPLAAMNKLKALRAITVITPESTRDKGSFGLIGGRHGDTHYEVYFIEPLSKDRSLVRVPSHDLDQTYDAILEGFDNTDWTPEKMIPGSVDGMGVYVDRYDGRTPVLKKLDLKAATDKYGKLKK